MVVSYRLSLIGELERGSSWLPRGNVVGVEAITTARVPLVLPSKYLSLTVTAVLLSLRACVQRLSHTRYLLIAERSTSVLFLVEKEWPGKWRHFRCETRACRDDFLASMHAR